MDVVYNHTYNLESCLNKAVQDIIIEKMKIMNTVMHLHVVMKLLQKDICLEDI